MSKREEKQKRKKEKLLKKVLGNQFSEVDRGIIPDKVANLPDSFDDSPIFVISFEHYSKQECEIDSIISNNDKCSGNALKLLRIMGNHCNDPNELMERGFKTKKIKKTNQKGYKKLFNKLKNCGVDRKDTDIYESYISNQGGRLFFWIHQKVIYIIAIRKNHY